LELEKGSVITCDFFAPLTMRVLVYAAGVYALGIGCAEAFAPSREVVCSGPHCALPGAGRINAGKLTATRMVALGPDSRVGAEDPADVMARTNAMMSRMSIHSAAASLENSYSQPSAANKADGRTSSSEGPKAKKWAPPVGYSPLQRVNQVPAEGKEAVFSRVQEMLESPRAPTATPKSYKPPVGYVPRSQTVQKDPLSSAPAKKWQPYAGYTPASVAKSSPVSSPSPSPPPSLSPSVSSSAASRQPEKRWQAYGGYVPESQKAKDPLSSAPAKKWQAYGGYEPKRDRPHTPAPAASATYSAPASYAAPSSPLKTDTLSSALATKWQPYGGYEPKRGDRPPTPLASAAYSPAPTAPPAPAAPRTGMT